MRRLQIPQVISYVGALMRVGPLPANGGERMLEKVLSEAIS
jgi:hypothetical protein